MEVKIFNPSTRRDLPADKICKSWTWGIGMPIPRVGEWVDCGRWWRGTVKSVRWEMQYDQPTVLIFLDRPKVHRSNAEALPRRDSDVGSSSLLGGNGGKHE